MNNEKEKEKDVIEKVWGEEWKVIKAQFKLTPQQFEAKFIAKGEATQGKKDKKGGSK